jgi:hypothetical protein
MLELKTLQLQLQNLKVTFNEALADPGISIEELRKIRVQITDLEKLIIDRKVFLQRRDSTN